jgi:hypothetical protein
MFRDWKESQYFFSREWPEGFGVICKSYSPPYYWYCNLYTSSGGNTILSSGSSKTLIEAMREVEEFFDGE